MTTPAKYGFDRDADRAIELTHALLRAINCALDKAAQSPGLALTDAERVEVADTINQGLESFQMASMGVAPFQKIAVGVKYLIRALDECKTKGPLGEG